MTDQKPAVVLVHGAFAESASWNGVVQQLRANTLEIVAAANPLRGVASDAAYLRDVIAAIDKPVVLVGHSYASFPITEAAVGNDSVVGLVYVIAFAPAQGENALALSGIFPGSTLGDARPTRCPAAETSSSSGQTCSTINSLLTSRQLRPL